MTTLLLIRHGHTDWIGRAIAGHTPGVALSADGRNQAERLVERLRAVPLAAIYSSPLQRTLETAQPLAQARNLPVQTRDRLIEVNFGEWTGMSMADLEKDPRWDRFNRLRSTARAPGGDLMLDVQSRMVDEMEELRLRHTGETIAVVSHQDSIKAALAHYLGVPLDLFHRFEIGPASVSVVQLADWGPRILAVNSTGEL
jgi:probable phosphomutase (TIGR03848 family)